MQSSKQLRYAGDVSIDKVMITTSVGVYQDITAQVLSVQFFEDIFSPFTTGSIIVRESLDLVNLFPFIGEEYLELNITNPKLETSSISGKYYIYKLSDRELLGDRSVVYQLNFISVEAIADINKSISRNFSGKVSDIVSTFVKDSINGFESKKNLVVEPTSNSIKYISQYWSPTKNIQYLVENAVNMNNTPNYVFFENRDGFYFISLEKLYDAQIKQTFKYDRYTRDKLPGGGDVRNIEEDYKRILEYSIPVAYDYMDRIRSGMLSSRQIMYDVTKKTYSTNVYTMFDRYDNQKHLNKYPINSNKALFRANSLVIDFPKDFANFSGFGDVTNSKHNQERLSLMKLAEANQLNITVPGRTDYTVGQKVSVVFPLINPISQKDNDTTDKVFSGNYLIAAINHYVDREKHECYMQLIKESSMRNMNGDKS